MKDGWVYLLGDWNRDGIYKIGVTSGDIDNRIKKLQTGNSAEIYLCDKFKTNHPFYLESQLHIKFGNQKILNEWFQLTDDEALHFKDFCNEIEERIIALKDNPFFPKNLNE